METQRGRGANELSWAIEELRTKIRNTERLGSIDWGERKSGDSTWPHAGVHDKVRSRNGGLDNSLADRFLAATLAGFTIRQLVRPAALLKSL